MHCNLHLISHFVTASPQGEALIYCNLNSLPLEGKVPRNEADEVSKETYKLPIYQTILKRKEKKYENKQYYRQVDFVNFYHGFADLFYDKNNKSENNFCSVFNLQLINDRKNFGTDFKQRKNCIYF